MPFARNILTASQLLLCLPQAYHSALAIRPDDSFTVEMLNTALEDFSKVDL
jgi:hypothetical protein